MIIIYHGKNIDIPSTIYTISFVTGDIAEWNVRYIFDSISKGECDFELYKGIQ